MNKEDILKEASPTQIKKNLKKGTHHTYKIGTDKKPEVKMGPGACSVSGCNCQSYMGNADTCQNCGHNWSLHW